MLNKDMIGRYYPIAFKKADRLVNFRQNRWGIYDTFLILMHLSLFILIVVKGVIV